jgi:hypothetical protein
MYSNSCSKYNFNISFEENCHIYQKTGQNNRNLIFLTLIPGTDVTIFKIISPKMAFFKINASVCKKIKQIIWFFQKHLFIRRNLPKIVENDDHGHQQRGKNTYVGTNVMCTYKPCRHRKIAILL